ncbi:hypothetical protein P3W45_000511 [Vairimorpha bombi]|jgi:telomerase reverse transcriptase
MEQRLKSLGFIPFTDFLCFLGISVPPNTPLPSHILCKNLPKITDINNRYNFSDLIKRSITLCILKSIPNTITSGYKYINDKLIAVSPNNLVNEISKYSQLKEILGDDLFMYILVHCTLIQKMEGALPNYLLISGNLNSEKKGECINRYNLFYKCNIEINIDPTDILKFIGNLDQINETVLRKCRDKYDKTDVTRIFGKYVKKNENTFMDPKSLVDFLFCVSKKIFGNVFSRYNFRILKQKLTLLVFRNKYETINEEELSRYFRINEFRFFTKSKITRYEYIIRLKISKMYLLYIFNNFYIPLINKLIYSTESCYSKSKVFYYPRHIWYNYAERCIKKHLSDEKRFTESAKTAYSNNIRVIPKHNEGRIVTNLNIRGGLNISNFNLQGEYRILKYEKRKKLNNSVLGYEDMLNKLYPMINRSNLYILKMDVKKCFDNIKHKYLERMIDKFYSNDNYIVKIFNEYVTKKEVPQILKRRLVNVHTEYKKYSEYFTKYQGKLISDDSYINEYKKDHMVSKIREVLLNNKIVHKNKVYKQIEGIPQGSILSTLVCSMYYSQMDEKYFNKVIKEGIVIRYVDDFLVLSTNKKEIKDFIKMSDRLEKQGVSFNKEKMERNFVIENGDLILKDSEVNYCGLKIKTINASSYIKNNLSDKFIKFSISLPPRKMGSGIFNKMINFINTRSTLLINNMNTKVYENIYDILVLFTWRLQILFKRAQFINMKFYKQIVNYGINKMYSICRTRNIKISKKLIKDMYKTIEERYIL